MKGQGQAVGLEDAGEEVEVGQQSFAGVKARTGVEARGVIEDVQQDLFVLAAGQPSVGAGVVLPEGTVVAGLLGIQNCGMATGLAINVLNSKIAALASAVFGPWSAAAGSLLASYWHARPVTPMQEEEIVNGQV